MTLDNDGSGIDWLIWAIFILHVKLLQKHINFIIMIISRVMLHTGGILIKLVMGTCEHGMLAVLFWWAPNGVSCTYNYVYYDY